MAAERSIPSSRSSRPCSNDTDPGRSPLGSCRGISVIEVLVTFEEDTNGNNVATRIELPQ